MPRLTRRNVVASGALLALGASAPARAAETVKVRIPAARTAFEPAELRIKAGDTVEWTNRSIVSHTVTCDPAKAKAKADAALPSGAEPFDSGMLDQDQTYSHVFTTPGTYRYFCTEHETMGMVATVTVDG